MYFILYLLKLSVTVMVITSFYWLVLRKLTFYRWNRIFLLAYPALAFLMPFLNIYDCMDPRAESDAKLVQAIPVFDFNIPAKHAMVTESVSLFQPVYMITALLVAGLAFFLLRLSANIYSFIRLRRSSVLLQEGPVRIYALKDASAHFSFGNSIFINPGQHTTTELERIVLHEYTHVKQRHTYDILWAEFLCIIMWFNPFAWLLRKCIRQNLEFLADQEVIEQGIAPREYQLLLLKVIGIAPHLLATPFGLSFLKKRIAMMNKNKTARIHTIKFLFVLPFLTILVLSFRSVPDLYFKNVFQIQPELKPVSDTVPPVKKKNDAPVAPVTPVTPVAPTAPAVPVGREAPLPPVPPAPPRIDTLFLNMDKTHKKVMITGDLKQKDSLPLYILDGQKILSKQIILQDLISPDAIESINILKGADALKKYGNEGKNGVIIINSKKISDAARKISDSLRVINANLILWTSNDVIKNQEKVIKIIADSVIINNRKGEFNKPIVILDNIIVSYDTIKAMNKASSIKEVRIYKGEEAIKLYGVKAANGVIIINSK